jgi:GAF domain-containing protein
MAIGPIQAFVIGFPHNDLFEGRIAEELARLSDTGQIRIVDAVFVIREGDDVAAVAVSDLDDDQRAELRTAVGALVGLGVAGADGVVAGAELGSSIDVDAATASQVIATSLVDELPDGSSALVLAIEHLWAVPLRDAVRDAGGLVLAHHSLTPEELVVLGMDIGDALAEEDA